MSKIKDKFLAAFGRMKVFPYPPVIVFDPHTFTIKGSDYYKIKEVIQPGDIILRGYERYLDGYFIPGNYSHASIYVGDCELGKETIIHAETPDIHTTDLVTFLRCDRVCVIRPSANTKTAIERSKSFIGTPYDYDFDMGDDIESTKRMACSEFIYHCFSEKERWSFNWKMNDFGFGPFKKLAFLPDDCLPSNDKLNVIFQK